MDASGAAGTIEIVTGACNALSPTATVTLPSLDATLEAVEPSVPEGSGVLPPPPPQAASPSKIRPVGLG